MIDVIIVGGGVAGMTCALNLLRAGKSVTIIEKETFGGQIANSPRVENIPSIKEISGADYSSLIFDQIDSLGVSFELEDVEKIEKTPTGFKVITNYETRDCKAVVLATGVTHRNLGHPKEEGLVGKGISYCAVCDGAFYKGQDVIVIGDANTALQYAILMASYCNKVHICALFDHLFADKVLVDRANEKDNIDITYLQNATDFITDETGYLKAVEFENTSTHEKRVVETKGCFIAIGQIPKNENFKDLVELDKGFIVTDDNMKTKTPGLYAIGDCRKKEYRQVITACNDGAIAAIEISKLLG